MNQKGAKGQSKGNAAVSSLTITKYYDAEEIRKTIDMLTFGNPYEIRIIYNDGKVRSGYFQGAEILIRELSKLNLEDCNVYITINQIHEGCYCRKQRDHFVEVKGKSAPSTSENDVTYFRWLLVDLDPIRPAGISSSDSELIHSKEIALKVIDFMTGLDFEDYIIALSGNGVHLLYGINEKATDENKQLLANCLKVLDAECSDEIVKIDAVNFKKAQICKLYGTLAQKGTNTADRPFRMSKIITIEELKEGAGSE